MNSGGRMPGTRVYEKTPHQLLKGEYTRWLIDRPRWYGRCPHGTVVNLSAHGINEHEDGTITVASAIRTYIDNQLAWIGRLERGVWIDP